MMLAWPRPTGRPGRGRHGHVRHPSVPRRIVRGRSALERRRRQVLAMAKMLAEEHDRRHPCSQESEKFSYSIHVTLKLARRI